MDLTTPPASRARLLAFDGGGIRGLFSLEIARRIEKLLREKHGRPDLVLADHFHYLGGTSTGAIIATFLSWGLPVDEVVRLYRENARVMFTKAGLTNIHKKHVFAFEDGGVTPFNNPAYLLYTMATLPEYRLHWPDGKERMSLVSVGTGRVKTGRGLKLDENLLGQAKSVPAALIGSAQWMQDLACRQHGECRHGEPLDSELGDLVRENPRAAFLYARYDKSIGEAEMEGALKVSKKGFTLDNIELMDFLGEMGREHARRVVKLEHFE